MEKIDLLFVKRKDKYQYVQAGTNAVAKPEDGIRLTISGSAKLAPPLSDKTPSEMVEWLKGLRDKGYSVSARDELGRTLSVDLNVVGARESAPKATKLGKRPVDAVE